MCIYYGNYRLPSLIKRDLRSGRKRQIRATGIIGHELNKQNAFMLMTRPDPIYIITAYLSQWRAPVDTDLTIIIIHVMGPKYIIVACDTFMMRYTWWGSAVRKLTLNDQIWWEN